MTNISIYVHIPFCESKCIYCAFSSFVPKNEQIHEYFEVLNSEIKTKSKKHRNDIVQTIFFGGGTPSVVDSSYIKKTLETIKQNFNLSNDAEISIECNPNSATYEKLCEYKKAGFNRISFGVQSLDEDLLLFLNRRHNKDIALKAIKNAKKIGFNNISADLLIGLQSQTKQNFLTQIDELVDAGITHISTYMLMIEKHTPLNSMKNKKDYIMNDDECVELYDDIVEYLNKLGFVRYEISNFSKSGYECKHNQVYWNMGEYLGFGLAAHSFVFGKRIANTSNFKIYLSQKNYQKSHAVTEQEKREEYVMLALRTRDGINLKKYKLMFGKDLLEEKKDEIKELDNFVEIKGDYLKIKQTEFGKTNLIILKLI